MQLWQLDATDLKTAFAGGQASPSEAVEALAHRIGALNPTVGAFTTLTLDRAAAEARRRTEDLARGTLVGPLHGIPVAVKELFDVAGATTTFGSAVFAGRVAEADAHAVGLLRAAGAIVLGLTRSHELGWGITTQHPSGARTRNPWDPRRIPGGSSGGSAAAVALGLVPLALGSDTGGSIRIPAAFCGVTGLKPAYGAISTRGAVPLAPSLDHAGLLARSVRDLRLGYEVLARFDPDDVRMRRQPEPSGKGVAEGERLDGLTIGVSQFGGMALTTGYAGVFGQAGDTAASLGAAVHPVQLGGAERIRPAFNTIQMAEALYVHTKVLGTYPGKADCYGADVRRRLELAGRVTIDDYLAATGHAAVIRRSFERLFEQVDLLLTPISAGGPARIDAPDTGVGELSDTPLRELVMGHTVPQNLAGLPACAVRAGFDSDGLPIGVQLSTAPGREQILLAAAARLQAALGDRGRGWPPLAAV